MHLGPSSFHRADQGCVVAEAGGINRPLKGKFMKVGRLLSFRVFLTLAIMELVYSAAKDFSLGYQQGVMSVAGN